MSTSHTESQLRAARLKVHSLETCHVLMNAPRPFPWGWTFRVVCVRIRDNNQHIFLKSNLCPHVWSYLCTRESVYVSNLCVCVCVSEWFVFVCVCVEICTVWYRQINYCITKRNSIANNNIVYPHPHTHTYEHKHTRAPQSMPSTVTQYPAS